MHRPNRAVAGVLCIGLLAACGSSEAPGSSAAPVNSVPSTTPVVATEPPTSAVPTTVAAARLLAGRPMSDCTIQSEAPVTATAPAVCGILEVPEDRSNPSGRTIGLRVAVIPAEADTPEPDAFFALAGGPNDAGTAVFGWLPGLFADVHAHSRHRGRRPARHRRVERARAAADARHGRPVAGRGRRPLADLVRRLVDLDRGRPPPVHEQRRGRRPRRGPRGARLRA